MRRSFFLLPLTVAVLGVSVYATVFTDPAQVLTKRYDFIVVGAGTAGSVIAARLSEISSVNILVIEAGLSDNETDPSVLRIPGLAGQGVGTQFDWNYTTTSQVGLGGRSVPYPRGFVLGGSSSINNMVYLRGPSEDFDRIASLSGDEGWSWSNIRSYIPKHERHVPAWSHLNETGEYDPSVHGHGPLLSSLTGSPSDLDHRVINTTHELSERFNYNLDLNSGCGLGVGWQQFSVGNSARSSSSTAYLEPALARGNLDLLIHTQVTKLIQTDLTTSAFRGVEVSSGRSGPVFTFEAQKEVILSAGSIGTPQILLLSGIGPKDELADLRIPAVVDLPDVGENLQDQPILMFQWSVKGHTTLSSFLRNQSAFAEALAEYEANKTGILASSFVFNTIGFLRLPNSSVFLKTFSDPSAGPHSPHFSLTWLNTFLGNPDQVEPTTGDWITVAVVNQSPTSRGSIKLVTNSPFDHPAVDPAFLTTPWDIGVFIEAVKSFRDFFSASPWHDYLGLPFKDAANLTTDAEIETYARRWVDTLKHPVGTSRISRLNDVNGVVSPTLTVKKTKGLRIVDASVIPFAVGGFPQAQVYLIAERAADLIKSEYGLQ